MTERAGPVSADPRLHAALGDLNVPDHDDEFWQQLGERLIAEREAPAAPTLDPLKRLEQVDRRDEPVEAEDRSRRDERKRRREAHREPDPAQPAQPAVSGLAEHAEWVRPAQRDMGRRLLVMACVLVAASVIAVAIWLGATAKQVSPTVTAGQVASRLSSKLGGSRYVLGGVTTTGVGADNGRYAFVRASNGSFRYRALDQRSDTAYDAETGTAQTWRLNAGGTADASEDVGLAPGPPDADGATRYLRNDELSTIVRTLEASPATLARTRKVNGQEQWIIDVRLRTSSDAPVDRLQVVVDKRRELPVEFVRSVKGVVVERKEFTDLRLASGVREDTFQLAFPAGASPTRFENGFQRTKMPSVRGQVGYLPLTPEWLPRGYELSTVAVLPGTPAGLGATAGGDNPPSRDVVSLAYRRGVEQLTVTVRRVASPSDAWKDPFISGSGPAGRVQRQQLDSGRFLGTTVEQVSEAGAPSHLWGRTNEFVFTVAGDVDPSQLLRVANSLT